MALAGGVGPDIFLIDNVHIPAWAEQGLIAPLEGVLSDEVIADFWPSIHPIMHYKGDLYAIPHHMSVTAFVYNVQAYSEAGITVPDDYLWSDLLEHAQKLTRFDGDKVARYGVEAPVRADGGGVYQTLPLIQMNGADIFDAEGNVAIDSPQAAEAMRFFQDLIHTHEVMPLPDRSAARPAGYSFTDQTVAAQWTWHSFLGEWRKQLPELDFNVVDTPRPAGGERASGIGGWYWVMSRDAKHPDAVKRFMAFLASEEFIEWLQGEAQPPISRRSVALEYIGQMDPRDIAILNALEYGRIRPRHQYWRSIEAEFARANGKIFAENQPVEMVLGEAARLIREALAQSAAE